MNSSRKPSPAVSPLATVLLVLGVLVVIAGTFVAWTVIIMLVRWGLGGPEG